jgi:hypothetical protein
MLITLDRTRTNSWRPDPLEKAVSVTNARGLAPRKLKFYAPAALIAGAAE